MEPIFISGMHRSGTTLLTRLLKQAGCFAGLNTDDNEETLVVMHANEQLFARAAASWDNPLTLRLAMQDSAWVAEGITELNRSLQHSGYLQQFFGAVVPHLAQCEPSGPWVLKDPRFVFTFPLWEQFFADAKLILIHRHGVDVASSLVHRHHQIVGNFMRHNDLKGLPITTRFHTGVVAHSLRCLQLPDAFDLWLEYRAQEEALAERLGDRCVRVQYETLLEQPRKEIERVLEFCGLADEASAVFHALGSQLQASRRHAYLRDPQLRAFADEHAAMLAKYGHAA